MKKLILLLSVIIFSLQANAQMWCAPGATWHYRVYYPFQPAYYDGHIKLTVTNTVTLNNITCYNMVGDYAGQTWSASQATLNGFVNIQTYESNKIVYVYNTDSLNFDTIANFNANVGDKWLGIKYPKSQCNFPFTNYQRNTVTVIDTGHMVINSLSLKKLKVSVAESSNTYTLTMVEKIGSLWGFLFPNSHCIIDGPVYGNFVCYSDNNFPLYDPTSAVCEYMPTALKESSVRNDIFSLYPNPNSGLLNLELDSQCNLKIYNALGALVFEKDFKEKGNFKVDISHLANGIYHVKAETNKGVSYSKLIKE